MICKCGNDSFFAHQLVRMDVIVDSSNQFMDNIKPAETAIYDSETPYGPYTCTLCGKEYEELG